MAASNVEQFMTNWQSQVFRDKIVAQIEAAREKGQPDPNSEDQMEKFLAQNTSQQLEEFVFGKSTAREHYLELVADLLLHMRQCKGKPRLFGDDSTSGLANGTAANGDHNENKES